MCYAIPSRPFPETVVDGGDFVLTDPGKLPKGERMIESNLDCA
jgi:hypothetical protein